MTYQEQLEALDNQFPSMAARTAMQATLKDLIERRALVQSVEDLFRGSSLSTNEKELAREAFRFIYYADATLKTGGNLEDPSHVNIYGRARDEIVTHLKDDRSARKAVEHASKEAAPHGIILGNDPETSRYYAINLNHSLNYAQLARVRRIIAYLTSYALTPYQRVAAMREALYRFMPEQHQGKLEYAA